MILLGLTSAVTCVQDEEMHEMIDAWLVHTIIVEIENTRQN